MDGVSPHGNRVETADLKLAVFDVSDFPRTALDPTTLALVDASTLVVFNKSDAVLVCITFQSLVHRANCEARFAMK